MTGRRPARDRRGAPAPGRVVRGVLVGCLLLAAASCGSAPESTHPTGVDQLTVPTPRPDPADFVDTLDNPWLPLAPGTVATYRVAPAGETTTPTMQTATITATVGEPGTIAGLTAVPVRYTVRSVNRTTRTTAPGPPTPPTPPTRWYAQDRAGNLWLVGVGDGDGPDGGGAGAGDWRVGDPGAQAGLAMPAAPRVGDAWLSGVAPGFSERVEVTGRDASAAPPYATYDGGLLELTRGPADPSVAPTTGGVTERYARDVGLVWLLDGTLEWALVSRT